MSKISKLTSMEAEGFTDLRDLLKDKAPSEARSILRQAVHGLAGKARDRMIERAPKDKGDMAKSIKAVRRRGTPDHPVSEVRGGATAPYMIMTEFGTSKTKAQPFIIPTVEEMRPKLAEEYREEFGKKLEKSLARKRRKASKD